MWLILYILEVLKIVIENKSFLNLTYFREFNFQITRIYWFIFSIKTIFSCFINFLFLYYVSLTFLSVRFAFCKNVCKMLANSQSLRLKVSSFCSHSWLRIYLCKSSRLSVNFSQHCEGGAIFPFSLASFVLQRRTKFVSI